MLIPETSIEQVDTKNVKVVFHGFDEETDTSEIRESAEMFCEAFKPIEASHLVVLRDDLTGATFTECHVLATDIIERGTTDVSLDPENSPEYRANRDIVASHAAFEEMKLDAIKGRKFSNIVCEFSPGKAKPLEVIGGQHRFEAISEAVQSGVSKYHGIKVYFDLNKEQRLDVQVISNTNISVPADLLDRMYATLEGADLRKWCQKCGLLSSGQDFSDKSKHGNPITVKEARTFLINFFAGKSVPEAEFGFKDTTPKVVETGAREPALWRKLKDEQTGMWSDESLLEAASQFSKLISSQREFFRDKKTKKLKGKTDQIYKTKNIAILAAWSFVAGALQGNKVRLNRHFEISAASAKDPLRADLLAKGKHASDPEAYRGLGFRSDPKERGRFAELFWLQAEKGGGFTSAMIDTAIKAYEAKRALLAHMEAKAKL